MRLSHFAAFVLILLALGCSAKIERSPSLGNESFESDYNIRFPAKFKPAELKTLATASGNLSVHSIRCSYNGAYYSITATEYPDAFGPVHADTILNGVRDGLKGTDGKVVLEERFRTDDSDGRNLIIAAGKNEVRATAILSKRRLYLIEVCGPSDAVKAPETEKFFRSFELTR